MHSEDQATNLEGHSSNKPLNRRDFVRALTIATTAGPGMIAAGLSGLAMTRSQRAEAAEAIADTMGKLPKVNLGKRTGNMKITPISMSVDWNRDLYAPALAMGVNFVHKAGYWKSMPDEFKNIPRESYYTDITVDNTSPGQNPDNYDQAYGQVVTSLEKNGLKYYDVYRAHYGWHSPEKVMATNNTSYKAFLKLKQEGKVKYFGVSQHPYAGTEEEIREKYAVMTQACIDSGIIDFMQVWYSYGYPQDVKDIFAKASKAGIAMTAMKINQHGRGKMQGDPAQQKAMKAEGQIGRALIRTVMTEKRPDGKSIFQTCVSALGNMNQFEENIGGLSPKVAARDGFDLYSHFA